MKKATLSSITDEMTFKKNVYADPMIGVYIRICHSLPLALSFSFAALCLFFYPFATGSLYQEASEGERERTNERAKQATAVSYQIRCCGCWIGERNKSNLVAPSSDGNSQ